MPVTFLPAEIEASYGRFHRELTEMELARSFHFDEADRRVILRRKGARARLGFAVQLGTVRSLGTFCPPEEVPGSVIDYVSRQFPINDPKTALAEYGAGQTRWAHLREIRAHFGYREFRDQTSYFQFIRWLYTRAWIRGERPSLLFELAASRLRIKKLLLPGVTTLTRLISRVRERASARLWSRLAHSLTAAQKQRLQELLLVEPDTGQSALDRLRRSGADFTVADFLQALRRIDQLRAVGVGTVDLSGIPRARISALAQYACAAKAQTVERLTPLRRDATLLAFAQTMEVRAVDDAIHLFDQLVAKRLSLARRKRRSERLRTLESLDRAATDLCAAVELLLSSEAKSLEDFRLSLFESVSQDRLSEAIATVKDAVLDRQEHKLEHLVSHYRTFNGLLSPLLSTLQLSSAPDDRTHPVLEALKTLADLSPRTRILTTADVPVDFVTKKWKKVVFQEDGRLDRKSYTVCAVERLRHCLRRRELYVRKSHNWGDSRRHLLEASDWEGLRARVCRSLGHRPIAEEAFGSISEELDAAYRRTLANLPENTAVRFDGADGHHRLVLTRLEAMEETDSLASLRKAVRRLIPKVDLPDILLEVDSWTGFTKEFRHVSETQSQARDLAISIAAVLVVGACNLGLDPVVSPGIAALSTDRLRWIERNYFRADTLQRANARLVEYQPSIPLTVYWGGGEVASADGLRFVVPVRSVHTGPNPKYFGTGRGITYYNFSTDQYTGFHGIVVPGTLRDSIFVLDGLLEHETNLELVELISDTAAYSDLVFGLFRLLGYSFSPRLAGLGKLRFWRIDGKADYGPLNRVSRNKINLERIRPHWDDILRTGGSLLLGKLSASQLIRSLQAGGRPTPLGRAIAEFGRVAKTIYMLGFIDDEAYRRRILSQLNRSEKRHDLARTLFFGKRGELRQPYREGQEDQLVALGLVINAIVLWNTRYMDAAIERLRSSGWKIKDEDVARLSPLRYEHINLHGRYHFRLPESVRSGALRELRDSWLKAE